MNLLNLSLEEFENIAINAGGTINGARHLFSQIYRYHLQELQQANNVSRTFLIALDKKGKIEYPTLHSQETSKDGTQKFAFKLTDGQIIESVLIPANGRRTLCISSQVGCAMGCRFCLTATMGFKRNLTTAEILGQLLFVNRQLKQKQIPTIDNVVLMGMGEPLANYTNTLNAVTTMQQNAGLGLSPRKIMLSTCGITPALYQFVDESPVQIAISLHATDDQTRTKLMPINSKYPISEIIEFCRVLTEKYNRQVLIEYILINDLNDTPSDAATLAEQLKGINCKINLITYNESSNLPYRRTTPETAKKFRTILNNAGFFTYHRDSRGNDISAACGQLATREKSL